MSAKTPRRTFAAPLVVTLALPVAGACVVKSGPATTPPPGDGTTMHANPPRSHSDTPPTPPRADPPPPVVQQEQQQQQTPPQAEMRSWHVYQNSGDKSCYAVQDVGCVKGATCNPPPPTKLERCPTGLEMPQGLTIREDSANSCAIYYPMPECPPNMSCNPPRPQTIACPSH
jgi:hypothetical protein